MIIEIPELCLVALVGATGSGKSSFAKTHFKSSEILSSDYFRYLISDDETDQSVNTAAFESLYGIANKRLDKGRLTVIDATNVQSSARKKIIELARLQNVMAVAIVFDMPEKLCVERNRERPDRNFDSYVVQNHIRDLQKSLRYLKKEGFRFVYTLNSPEEAESAEIVKIKLWNNKKDEGGPFDIIGDVHGCYDELCSLLEKLGWSVDRAAMTAKPPKGRRAVFLGDLCDRGPENMAVAHLVINMVEAGDAVCVPGNHDIKLLRKLQGKDVKLNHGFDLTIRELEKESPDFIDKLTQFIDGLVSHYVLDNGNLVVAHAGISEKLQGRSSGTVRGFCLYGETTGENDEFGLPVRVNWAEDYKGTALVVYGHNPSTEVRRINNTICIDTGCAFGGQLTAYRYPEGELIDVPANREYYVPARPLGDIKPKSLHEPANILDIKDILMDQNIQTRFYRDIYISKEKTASTLEIAARFSVDPRWLIYLPPTMSPCGTSTETAYLEHPNEAFDYYHRRGIDSVVCEEKYMGSRGIIVICRNVETVRSRFGIDNFCQSESSLGIIYTRTGRRFFDDHEAAFEQAILTRLNLVLEKTGFWEKFATDWVCLDTEIMPWSAKARSLILEQYAPTGMAGQRGLEQAILSLQTTANRVSQTFCNTDSHEDLDLPVILKNYQERLECVERYRKAYRSYCWPVTSADDYLIVPFHILATEGRVWNTENHLQHIRVIRDYIAGVDPVFTEVNHLVVNLDSNSSITAGIDWWLELTNSGAEGMVVKPLDFIPTKNNRLLQPAVKCRGREYLRIIYGPEYTAPENLDRLKIRSLRKKQELALSEFSLGMESLERFVNRESLQRVHECIFAILCLENEDLDPRL